MIVSLIALTIEDGHVARPVHILVHAVYLEDDADHGDAEEEGVALTNVVKDYFTHAKLLICQFSDVI